MDIDELKSELSLNNVSIVKYSIQNNKFDLEVRFKSYVVDIVGENKNINTSKLLKRIIKNLTTKEIKHIS